MKLVKMLLVSIGEALSMMAGAVVFTIAAAIAIMLILGVVVVTESKSHLHLG